MCRIPPCSHNTVHIADAYGSTVSLASPFKDAVDGLVPAQRIDRYPENVSANMFAYPALRSR
jgi:hypothetical protein